MSLFTLWNLIFFLNLIKLGSKREGCPECIRRIYRDLFPGAGVGPIRVSLVHFELQHARARPRGLTRGSHHRRVTQSNRSRWKASADQIPIDLRGDKKCCAFYKRRKFWWSSLSESVRLQRASCVHRVRSLWTWLCFRAVQWGAAPTGEYVTRELRTSHWRSILLELSQTLK